MSQDTMKCSPLKYRQLILPLWHVVEQIRNKVAVIVADRGEELSYACKMVTSELVENAVKYGMPIDPANDRGIEFDLSIENDKIAIAVANRVASEEDLTNVTSRIDAINESGNPQALYVQRLMALLEEPGKGGSQLGLYRIAYEGEFSLAYKVFDGILTVIASKHIGKN